MSSRSGGRSRFEYRERSPDAVKKRAEQGGGTRDSYVRDDIKLWVPKVGDNIVRFLPPTWKGAEHFGFDVHLHYSIGADKNTYLCLAKMLDQRCPLCDERRRLENEGDQDAADALKPGKRVLVWMIDRNEEKEGPMVWSMPWTIDRDISKLVIDRRTGEILPIDHPEEGYDFEFERKGAGTRTEYMGLQFSRRSSDLGDDSWLDKVQDNPLPDVLVYHDAEHIEQVFFGQAKSEASAPRRASSEVDDGPRARRDPDRDEPKSARARIRDDDDGARDPGRDRDRGPRRDEVGPRTSRRDEDEEPPPRERARALRNRASVDDDEIPY